MNQPVFEKQALATYNELEEFEFVERTSPAYESCHHKKCCREFWIPLTPHETKYLQVDWNWIPGAAVLAKKKNGDCIYLTDGRCQIYENRPVACREYICVEDERMQESAG